MERDQIETEIKDLIQVVALEYYGEIKGETELDDLVSKLEQDDIAVRELAAAQLNDFIEDEAQNIQNILEIKIASEIQAYVRD